MKTKLIVALVDDSKTEIVLQAARAEGATGATVITSARGEGRSAKNTFLGLELESKCDVLLFLVDEGHAEAVLKRIGDAGQFDGEPGAGIAFRVDVEDTVGLAAQMAQSGR